MRIVTPTVRAAFLPLLLAGTLLPLAPARASSVTVAETPAKSAAAAPASAQSCAEGFHARFAAIRTGPFAALAAAAKSANETSAPATGTPARDFLFEPARAGRSSEETAALRNARRWLATQSVGGAALDRNGRWIAARIREDLGDYLGQGPSPYLCAGVANYLASIGRYADQIRVSPERRERDVEAQRGAARDALAAAISALRPVPLPRFAPADRPGTLLVAQELAESPVSNRAEMVGPPMRVAAHAGAATQVSEGSSDPDLPPLRTASLDGESDLLGAIDRIAGAIVATEPLRPAETLVSTTDSMTTGSIAAAAPQDPVRRRLQDLVPTVAGIGDARARDAVSEALGALEALDALQHARSGAETPFVGALDATFAAIRDAHHDACRCTPAEASAD